MVADSYCKSSLFSRLSGLTLLLALWLLSGAAASAGYGDVIVEIIDASGQKIGATHIEKVNHSAITFSFT